MQNIKFHSHFVFTHIANNKLCYWDLISGMDRICLYVPKVLRGVNLMIICMVHSKTDVFWNAGTNISEEPASETCLSSMQQQLPHPLKKKIHFAVIQK